MWKTSSCSKHTEILDKVKQNIESGCTKEVRKIETERETKNASLSVRKREKTHIHKGEPKLRYFLRVCELHVGFGANVLILVQRGKSPNHRSHMCGELK